MGYSSNETFNKSLSKVIYSPLEKINGRRQTALLTFEGGRFSDIQLGHKNQGNDRDILAENNKKGGRDCFFIFNSSRKNTHKAGICNNGPGQGRVAKTEVAGRPPLPRHKRLPAGKK